MSRVKIFLIIGLFIVSIMAINIQSLNEKVVTPNSVSNTTTFQGTNSTTFPIGHASVDLHVAISNQLTTSNGPTTYTDQTGRTIFYDLNVHSFPLSNLLTNVAGVNVSSVFQQIDLNHTQLFIKVLRQEGNMLDMIAGLRLANDQMVNLTPVFNTNNVPDFLQSFILPKDLTVMFPNMNTLTNPFSEKTDINCPYCSASVSPFGPYVNPNNFTGAYNAINNQLTDLKYSSNKTRVDYIDLNQITLPASMASYVPSLEPTWGQIYYVNTIVQNGKITLPMSASGISGVYLTSQYNFSVDQYSQVQSLFSYYQNYNPLFSQIFTSFQVPNYYYYWNGTTTIFYNTPIPDGTQVTIPFYPDSGLYAQGDHVYIPNANISKVYGVYLYRQVSSTSYDNIPASVTNFYSGGSFTNGNITLSTVPNPNEKLVVYYEEQNQPTLTTNSQYIPGVTFNFGMNLTQLQNPMASLAIQANWDMANNPGSGWMNNLDIKVAFDSNNDSVITPSTELFDVSLVFNKTASYQTNNPLSVGDAGTYTVTNSNLQLDLTNDWQTFWDSMMPNSTTELQNTFNSMQNKKFLDYQVTGVDGMYYSLNGTQYSLDQNNTVSSYLNPTTDAYSAFNGLTGTNNTIQTMYSYYSLGYFMNTYSSMDLVNYYKMIFPTAPISWTKSSYGDNMVVENVTVTNSQTLNLSLPFSEYDNVYLVNASLFNYSVPVWSQNSSLFTSIYSSGYTALINNSNIVDLSSYGSMYPIGSDWVAVYYPDTQFNAINGVVYLPSSLNPTNVTDVYYTDYSSPYYNYSSPLYSISPSGSFSGNMVFLSSSAASGMYRVGLDLNYQAYPNHRLYQTDSQLGVFPTITNLNGIILPARTAGNDFDFMKRDVNAFNSFTNQYTGPITNYLQDYLNTNFSSSLTHNLSLAFNLGTFFSNDSSGNLLEYNASFSAFVPFKMDGSVFVLDTNVSVNGLFGFWIKWDTNGILQSFGLDLHLSVDSADQTATSSSTTSLTSTSTSSTSQTGTTSTSQTGTTSTSQTGTASTTTNTQQTTTTTSSSDSTSTSSGSTSTSSNTSENGSTITTSPGFELIPLLFSLATIVAIMLRRKNNS